MKNHTPDLMIDQMAEITALEGASDVGRLIAVSQVPFVMSGVIPDGPLESELELGQEVHGNERIEQARKDWYVLSGSNTYCQDMMPPCNTHIAVNLKKRNRICEGFLVRLSDSLLQEDEYKQRFGVGFLEVYRNGDKELAALLKERPGRVVTGTVAMASVKLRASYSEAREIPAVEQQTMFLLHRTDEIIGWQYVYQNGQLAKPIRQDKAQYLVSLEGESCELSLLDVKTGAIHTFCDEGQEAPVISGHATNVTYVEKMDEPLIVAEAIKKFMHGRFYPYHNNASFIVTDPITMIYFSSLMSIMATKTEEKEAVTVTYDLKYRPVDLETKDKNSAELAILRWKELGMDYSFNERMIVGSMRNNGLKNVVLPKALQDKK